MNKGVGAEGKSAHCCWSAVRRAILAGRGEDVAPAARSCSPRLWWRPAPGWL